MSDETMLRSRAVRWGGAAALLIAGGVAGGVLGASLTADAADGSGTDPGRPDFPMHGTAAHEDQEKPVTGTNATKARAAAVKAVVGKAGAVTTDFTGDGYEVTVTKSDGSTVEVHLDSSFNVMEHGFGDHGPDGDGPDDD